MYYKNHFIKKNLSQTFLKDKKIINSIIQTINIQKNEKIIEIGPGLGALTKHIVNITDYFIAIEQDFNLVKRLNQILNKKNFKILHQDVMTIDFSRLTTQNKKKLRLVGNLPYHISTKFIIHLLKYTNIIYDMHFMFQKEVAKRFLAKPNTKEYGRLSIIMQYYYNITPLLEIPMTAFFPVPKVESMMIQLSPYKYSPYPIINKKKLSTVTKIAFNQRRKYIKNSLSSLFNSTEIQQHNINTNLRAENLTIHQYCTLAQALQKKHDAPNTNK